MIDEEEGETKNLYSCHPPFTWDNYFSGDQIMDYVGGQGFDLMMTCMRDRLPKEVPLTYFHKEKMDSTQKKVARFLSCCRRKTNCCCES